VVVEWRLSDDHTTISIVWGFDEHQNAWEQATLRSGEEETVSKAQLTTALVERVMDWRVRPDRFLTNGRQWIRRSAFDPLEKIDDAFRLLEHASAEEYEMSARQNGLFSVRIRINGTTGEASHKSKPTAISQAIARALGIDLDS
jgi:hypothetical protein